MTEIENIQDIIAFGLALGIFYYDKTDKAILYGLQKQI